MVGTSFTGLGAGRIPAVGLLLGLGPDMAGEMRMCAWSGLPGVPPAFVFALGASCSSARLIFFVRRLDSPIYGNLAGFYLVGPPFASPPVRALQRDLRLRACAVWRIVWTRWTLANLSTRAIPETLAIRPVPAILATVAILAIDFRDSSVSRIWQLLATYANPAKSCSGAGLADLAQARGNTAGLCRSLRLVYARNRKTCPELYCKRIRGHAGPFFGGGAKGASAGRVAQTGQGLAGVLPADPREARGTPPAVPSAQEPRRPTSSCCP